MSNAEREPIFTICGRCGFEYEVTEGCDNCNPKQFIGEFTDSITDSNYAEEYI